MKRFVLTIACVLLAACAGGLFNFNARQAFEEGVAQFNLGNYEAAAPHFQKAIELDPEYAQAYLYLGRTYISQRRWIDAVPPLRTAFRLAPADSRKEIINVFFDALFAAATADFQKGNFESAFDYLKEAGALAPESANVRADLVETLMGFGASLLSQGRYPEAATAFGESVKMAPDNVNAYIGLARAFFSSGDFTHAYDAALNALNLAPASPEAQALFRSLLSPQRREPVGSGLPE